MKKSIALMVVGLLIAVPLSAQAFPTKKGDKPCMECHKLDKKAAEDIVKKVIPNATVTNVIMSPVKGVWQIEFEAGEGKRGGFGLDFSKKYLVQFALVDEVVKQQKQQQQPRKVDISKIPLGDSITLGAAAAKKKVIVFTDPDCPFCRQLHDDHETGRGKAKRYRFYPDHESAADAQGFSEKGANDPLHKVPRYPQ